MVTPIRVAADITSTNTPSPLIQVGITLARTWRQLHVLGDTQPVAFSGGQGLGFSAQSCSSEHQTWITPTSASGCGYGPMSGSRNH